MITLCHPSLLHLVLLIDPRPNRSRATPAQAYLSTLKLPFDMSLAHVNAVENVVQWFWSWNPQTKNIFTDNLPENPTNINPTGHNPSSNLQLNSKDIHSPFVPRLSIVSSSFVSPRSFWSSAILAAQPCSGHFRVVASEANGMLTWNEGIPLWSPELCIFLIFFEWLNWQMRRETIKSFGNDNCR